MKAIVIAIVIVASSTLAMADGIAPSDEFPPIVGRYNGTGIFATEIVSMSLSGPSNSVSPGSVPAGYPCDSFFDVFVTIDFDGGGLYHIESFFDVFTELTIEGGAGLRATGTFATEIVSMSLSGNIGGHEIEIRESPQFQSTGEHTVTDLGGGGMYHIDSFFDVFTELSVDGGSFVASKGPIRMDWSPEPGTLSLLALGGLAILRRRRRK